MVALKALSHAGIGWSSSSVEEHCCSVCGVLVMVGTVWVTGCVVNGVVVVWCTLGGNNCSSNVCVCVRVCVCVCVCVSV